MEIEEAKVEEQNDDDDVPGPATPDRGSEAETESEDEASDSGLTGGSTGRIKSNSMVTQPAKDTIPSSEGPPPPRALPFGRAGTRSKGLAKEQSPPPPADNDDDETDEEL